MRKLDQFVLLISDKAATLFHLQKGQIKDFCQLEISQKSSNLLNKFPKAPIHLLIDSPSFHLETQRIPFINPLDLWRWYQTKTQEWRQLHGLSATKFHRQKGHWYLQKIAVNQELVPWIHWLKNQDHSIGSISVMACELRPILSKLQNSHHWQMLVTLHQAGHMNLTLFDQDQFLQTCQVPLTSGLSPQELAQQILQGLESTLHQLCSSTPDLLQKINIFTVLDEETQRYLKPRMLAPHQFHSLTPYQMAMRLSIPGKVPFRFSDQILIRHWNRQWKKDYLLQSQFLQYVSFFKNPKLIGASLVILGSLGYFTFSLNSSPQISYQSTKNLSLGLQPKHKPDIYLGSLIYIDATHWTAWINNEPVRAQEPHPFDIIDITSQSLTFHYNDQIIILNPDHTYWSDENQVIIGDQRRNERQAD